VTDAGLPHDRVRIRTGPERLGDEPRPQGMPTQQGDLRRCETCLTGAALDHPVHRMPRHRLTADGAGGVHPRKQSPFRVREVGQVARRQ
jgi:hypothetical protein